MPLNRAFVQQQPISSFPNTSTITESPVTTTSSVVLAARPAGNRRGFAIDNDGMVSVVIGYAATVSAAARTFRIDPGDYFEDPFNYQGAISALSIGGAGALNITELTIV